MEARLLFFGMCLLYSTVHTNGRLENYEKHKRPNFGTGKILKFSNTTGTQPRKKTYLHIPYMALTDLWTFFFSQMN